MHDLTHISPDNLRWIALGLPALLTIVVVCAILLPATKISACVMAASSNSADSTTARTYEGSNVISNGVLMATDKFSASMASAGQTLRCRGQLVAANFSQGSKLVTRNAHIAVAAAGHGLYGGAAFVAHTANNSLALIIYVPSHILRVVTETSIVSAAIKPAANTSIPTIDPALPATIAARAALLSAPPAQQAVPPSPPPDSVAAWPIHGAITTPFGVPHWPYQATHTGLDISDGQPSGVTPIRPFKPGHVIEIVRSSSGLGNHVTIDHGEGITSVYGHMASISVQAGQTVDKTTVLGFEGSTGASTGPHLHFEIRVNGQPKDPLLFVDGRP